MLDAEQNCHQCCSTASCCSSSSLRPSVLLTSTCWMVACSSATLQLSVTRTLLQQLPSCRFTTTQLGRIALPLPAPLLLASATLLLAIAALLCVLLRAAAPPVAVAGALIAPAAVLAGNGLQASLRCCSSAMMFASVLCDSTTSGCMWQGAGPGRQRYTSTGSDSCRCMYTTTCRRAQQSKQEHSRAENSSWLLSRVKAILSMHSQRGLTANRW
jgi:hypothetical protein